MYNRKKIKCWPVCKQDPNTVKSESQYIIFAIEKMYT